jgi:hypothetical protein
MKRTTPLGDVITLPKVTKQAGGSPLLEHGHITIVLSTIQTVAPMHYSWWWTGWETILKSRPHAALNAKYYQENYPTSVGGEDCTWINFKDGTNTIVKGNYKEITQMIFGDIL